MEKKNWDEMTNREKERYYNSCSKCGLEKDSEGWCPNYCMDSDDEEVTNAGVSLT